MTRVYFYRGEDADKLAGFMSMPFRWVSEGLDMMLARYYCVYESDEMPADVVSKLRSWRGTDRTSDIRRLSLSNGDLFSIDGDYYAYYFGKLLLVPDFISTRLVVHG